MLNDFRAEESSMKVIGAERPVIDWDAEDAPKAVNGSVVATLTQTLFTDVNELVLDVFSRYMTSL